MIADTGSFIAAANALNRTPSAISLQMKAFEESFGTHFFDRAKRPPVLNRQGRSILRKVREIVSLYDAMDSSVTSEEITGVFEIGAVPTTLTGILPHALAAYQRRHDKLQIRLTDDLSSGLMTRLLNGEIDAALISKPTETQDRIIWHPVAREYLTVIAPAGTQGNRDTDLLEGFPYIRFTRKAWIGQIIEQHLREREIQVKMIMELDNLEAISTMVFHGLGVSIVPRRCVDSPNPLPLKQLPFGNPPVSRTIGLVELASNPRKQVTRGFYEELMAASKLAQSH